MKVLVYNYYDMINSHSFGPDILRKGGSNLDEPGILGKGGSNLDEPGILGKGGPGNGKQNLHNVLDSRDPINELKSSINSLFSAFYSKNSIVKFFKSFHEDKNITIKNRNIEINDNKIVYHFEKLDVNFPFKANGELFLDKISYNFPEDFNDNQKCEILSRFYSYILEKYRSIQYDVGEDTIGLSALGDSDYD